MVKRCPKCGGLKVGIVTSRVEQGGIAVVRWRQCRACGVRWKTVEVSEAGYVKMQEQGETFREALRRFKIVLEEA